jgi:hypothetical protein
VKITKITAEMLKAGKACRKQTSLFRKMFPDGAKITRGNWEKAKGVELDVLFCAKFLSPRNLAKYTKIRDSAWEVHEKVYNAAWVEYCKVCDSTWAGYAAWTEYAKVCGSAQDVYEKVRDTALFTLLKNQK